MLFSRCPLETLLLLKYIAVLRGSVTDTQDVTITIDGIRRQLTSFLIKHQELFPVGQLLDAGCNCSDNATLVSKIVYNLQSHQAKQHKLQTHNLTLICTVPNIKVQDKLQKKLSV